MTRVVVVGDALLDVDLLGRATKFSPDGPVPVVEVDERRERPGGAGLVAAMLARDGARVVLVTALADDAGADRLRAALDGVDVRAGRLEGPTPEKTRVRAGGHPVARIDEGCGTDAAITGMADVVDVIATADVVVAADYGRGVLADPDVRAAIAARAPHAPVVWDPHPRGPEPVPGVRLATPNRVEAAAFAGAAIDTVPDAIDVAAMLRDRWDAAAVGVTLDRDGAVVVDAGGTPAIVGAEPVTTTDPCGAGDRLAASAALALARGHDPRDAMRVGVEQATAFLAAGGVASLAAPAPRRLTTGAPGALALARDIRARGGTLVATGGCFDLLHAGHVRTLSAARALGDALVVLLNSDASVRRLKGPSRPIISQQDRVDLLLALECVDAVLVFDDDTPVETIRRLAPDVWVKGGDYDVADLPESAVLAELGGRTVTVPYHPARSTSHLAAALAAVG